MGGHGYSTYTTSTVRLDWIVNSISPSSLGRNARKMIALDFETFYSRTHSISLLGPWAYAHHEATDIYMVSVYGEGIDFCGDPRDFDWSELEGKDLVSHNAGFDQVVARAGVERGIIPPFLPKSWSCSADLVAACGLPRALADASAHAFDEEVPKLMRNWMSGKHWSDAVAKGKDKELIDYARRDSIYCLRLWEAYASRWPSIERRLSAHTRGLQTRGVYINQELLDAGIKSLSETKNKAEALIPWSSDPDKNNMSLGVVRAYCRDLGIPAPKSMAKDSEECQKWEDKYADKYPFIRALRDYRRSNMLLRKLESIKVRLRPDGTMPVNLKYWGAHTGRWSGDAGVNLQNLPRGEMFGVTFRHLLVPRPDHRFVICDLSQIEPRVLYWLAQDTEMLQQLKDGVPLYEAHARATMGWGGGKLKDERPDLYQLAKARVLGLGYGCGGAKFQFVAKAMAGLELQLAEAKRIVSEWRQSNPSIVQYWRSLDHRLKVAKVGRFPSMEYTLPSGRVMHWDNPRPDPEDRTSTLVDTNGRKTYTWGGKLTENVVQAVSRDIFSEMILNIEAAGYSVVWHVHDEGIAEVPVEQADSALEQITSIMSTPPEWATNLPLAAEGAIFERYDK